MAIQHGIIPLSGKIGEVVFSNRKGKRYAKLKSTKPINQTADTKKSSTDFGEASKLGSRVRNAFSPLISNYGDSALVGRFTKQILRVIGTIPKTSLGAKKFSYGDVSIFRDFQFNTSIKLATLLHEFPKVKLQPSGLAISFKEERTVKLVRWVPRAASAVIQLMVYNLNLDDVNDEVFSAKDLLISGESEHFRGAKLQVPLTLKGERIVWVAIGIHYLGDHNQFIGDKTKRAGAIVKIMRLSDGVEVKFTPEQPTVVTESGDDGKIGWDLT